MDFIAWLKEPYLLGVLFAWFVSCVPIIFILWSFRKLKKNYETEYKKLKKPLEKLYLEITIVVLIYLGIYLSSKGLTGKGIYYLDYNISKPSLFSMIKFQDFLLTIFTIFILMILFIAPFLLRKISDKNSKYNKFIYAVKNILNRISIDIKWSDAEWAINCLFIFFVVLLVVPAIIVDITPPAPPPDGVPEIIEPYGFLILCFFASIVSVIIIKKKKINIRESDFSDIYYSFSFLPAIIIGSLLLIPETSLKFGVGNIYVGLLIIGGFWAYVSVANKVLDSLDNSEDINYKFLAVCSISLAFISGFSVVCLLVQKSFEPSKTSIISAPVAFLLLILPYEKLYENVWKYQFGNWWKKKKMDMFFIIVTVVMLVALLQYNYLKLIFTFLAVVFFFFLPFIFKTNAAYWGFVLLKVKPGNVDHVKKEIDKKDGVYQPMTITGNYDVIANIEASNHDEFMIRIQEIGKIKGIKAVATAIDTSRILEKR